MKVVELDESYKTSLRSFCLKRLCWPAKREILSETQWFSKTECLEQGTDMHKYSHEGEIGFILIPSIVPNACRYLYFLGPTT